TKRATVTNVEAGSAAAAAKLQRGDEILSANGQPLVSVADFQWILHNMPGTGGEIALKVRRAGREGDLTLNLADGWRKKTDYGWRVSTWDLRRIALGGMILEPDPAGNSPTGLHVKNAGRYGNHAVARKAGVRPDDKVLAIAGIVGKATEAEVITHILNSTKKGQPVTIKVKRGGREMDFLYKTQ
ncbi:MAG: PDZ domain-containing protein, partial [Verrucomicrobiales bacterium]|nr:PDZ domain-containing protein [Verrucomicrobiales bacterium]